MLLDVIAPSPAHPPKPRSSHTPGLLLLSDRFQLPVSVRTVIRSTRFDLIFLVVLSPLLIREFTYPHLLTPMTLRARGFIRSKGANFMPQLLTRFWKDQSGATAIEYGLIAAGISVAIIAAVNGIGTKLNTSFGSISTQLK
jgi:pilus assembly protein Flp/PilA